MDAAVRQALETDLTVDITTTGRRTGRPQRIEIWMLHLDGRFFITGTAGPRSWLANVTATPELVVHVKQRVRADLPARAEVVTDELTRRWVLTSDAAAWYREQQPLAVLMARSPMIEVHFDTTN